MEDDLLFAINSFASYLKKRADIPPKEAYNLYEEGFDLYQTGYYKPAAEKFLALINAYPSEKNYWFAFASAKQQEKNFDEALKAWAVAAFLDKENPYPHFHAAECLFSRMEKKQAFLALEDAKERGENDLRLLARITILEQQQNKANL